MLECLILGDSIAVGTHLFRPECQSLSKGGITSHGWQSTWQKVDLSAKTVIISLGTNDWEKADTAEKLREIRARVKAERVFWILPNETSKPLAAANVKTVAGEREDTVITTRYWQQDRIHPSWTGYCELVNQTR